jgi:hypothetical protein
MLTILLVIIVILLLTGGFGYRRRGAMSELLRRSRLELPSP